ncbi:Nif3-like dinuclear metal center hexameric protein [bacterium]|nr:Nif3-like dinuclear metal center hexameric protein [bacterium]
MTVGEITQYLETIAPANYQESYDNSGLIVGRKSDEVKGVLVSLDCIESTVKEAIERNCNMIVAHHPIVFGGLKRFNGANYVQKTVELAIKHDIAIYAIHTNLDNVLHLGVNQRIAEQIGLKNLRILQPKAGHLRKLVTYAPHESKELVLNAMFDAGAGHIGNYSECSFSSSGEGTFKGNEDSNPTVGKKEERHTEAESRIEVILRAEQVSKVLKALNAAHPYEEVAYEIYAIENADQEIGSGMIGELPESKTEADFLKHLKDSMELNTIRFTAQNREIKRVALCGGSGSFLLPQAKSQKADAFVTADFKYHQFFDAEDQILICDIGHYESEKYTIDLLKEVLSKKFSTFAVLKTEGDTNPINYFH